MSAPTALGRSASSLTPIQQRMDWGDSALTAPTSPSNRLPVVDKTKVDPQIRKAAEGMEAMFLDYLMKTMRQTVPKSEMDLENPATEVYRAMSDSEMAQKAARAGGVGLADQIIAYLEAGKYTQNAGHGVSPAAGQPARRTGGTHEGQ